MPPDHCHPAKSGYLYSGADKTRLEKNEDIRKIIKINAIKPNTPAILQKQNSNHPGFNHLPAEL